MRGNLYERIAVYCEKNRLFAPGDGVVVGLSGGADSVFLLLALSALRERLGISLFAVHVNHGIRRETAQRDERFAVAFAKEHGVSCRVFRGNVPKLAKKNHQSEEEAGRAFRYECFEQYRQELGCASIAVAHHQDDQAETVLFQLLRGSSLRGMGGMAPKRGRIVRPLLAVGRLEIEQWLDEHAISYCTDETNRDISYTRNRLRREVLPYLREHIQPALSAHIAQTAADLRQVSEYLALQVQAAYGEMAEEREGKICVSAQTFAGLHPVVQRELVLLMIEKLCGRRKDITRQHVDAVCGIFGGATGKEISLPYGLRARRQYETALLEQISSGQEAAEMAPDGFFLPVVWEQQYSFPLGETKAGTVILRRQKRPENFSAADWKKNCTKCFDYDKIASMPMFRYPLEGDYLWLDPSGAKKKLSRFFIDEKLPAAQRSRVVVLAEGNHILWVPQLGRVSAYYYVTAATEEIVTASLQYETAAQD